MSTKHTPYTQLTNAVRQSLSSLSESDRERVLAEWGKQKSTVSSLMEGSSSSTRAVVRRDPNRPKKAMSPYLVYSQMKREELRRTHPDLKAKDILREIGKTWKVDQNDKALVARLEEAHAKDVKRYEEAMKSYVPPVVDESEPQTKSKRRESTTPKKPTGYNLHNKEMAHVLAERNVSAKERFTVLGQMWKALTEEQREAYNARARAGDASAPAVAPVATPAPAVATKSSSRAKSPSPAVATTPAPAVATKQVPKKAPAPKKQLDSDDEELQEEAPKVAPARKVNRK
jgi:hypothetical protein